MELLKLYKNRFRYKGKDCWEKVVHSAIRRRVGDYRVWLLRGNDRLVTENRLTVDDEHCGVLEFPITESKITDCPSLRKAIGELTNSPPFTEWDAEVYEVIAEAHKRGDDLSDENIAYYMGYDKDEMREFRNNMEEFRKRIKESGAKSL